MASELLCCSICKSRKENAVRPLRKWRGALQRSWSTPGSNLSKRPWHDKTLTSLLRCHLTARGAVPAETTCFAARRRGLFDCSATEHAVGKPQALLALTLRLFLGRKKKDGTLACAKHAVHR
ncbi:hypothetical protein MRX96_025787 [Rhipicephalus microplus]